MVPSELKLVYVLTVALIRRIWSHLRAAVMEWNVERVRWLNDGDIPWKLFRGKNNLPRENYLLGRWKEDNESWAGIGYAEGADLRAAEEMMSELQQPLPPDWFDGGWAKWTSYRLGRIAQIERWPSRRM